MKPISEYKKWTIEELREQYKVRMKLKDRMVGALYPSVLADDIRLIVNRIYELGGKLHA